MDFEILLESEKVKLDLAGATVRALPPRGLHVEGKPRVPEHWESLIVGACYAIELKDEIETVRRIFKLTKRTWLPSGLIAVELQREDWMDDPVEARERLKEELKKFAIK